MSWLHRGRTEGYQSSDEHLHDELARIGGLVRAAW